MSPEPARVRHLSGGNKIFYHYDAAGNKVAQSREAGSGAVFESTGYIGNIVCDGDAPAVLLNDEGRAVFDANDNQWRYEYFPERPFGQHPGGICRDPDPRRGRRAAGQQLLPVRAAVFAQGFCRAG
ncbi:MAG: hypothetical protein QM786_17960 [Breznakibacter sp.]